MDTTLVVVGLAIVGVALIAGLLEDVMRGFHRD